MRYSCVLMFSGGRDSTLAAIRLQNDGKKLILVTMISEYLEGISSVESRLIELSSYLSADTLWVLLADLGLRAPTLSLAPNTCLPCFLKYTSSAVILARKYNIPSVAFGFTRYQSECPEQTLYAIYNFRKVLNEFGIHLEIPVYNIISKKEAIEELRLLDLNTSALEQKCSRQTTNEEIPESVLKTAIDEWAQALQIAIQSNLSLAPTVISSLKLREIKSLTYRNEVGPIGKYNKRY